MRVKSTSDASAAASGRTLLCLLAALVQLAACQSCTNGLGESFCGLEPSHSVRYCPVGCRPGECSRQPVAHQLESAALARKFVGAHQFAGSMCLSTCSNPSQFECQEESTSIKGFSYCSKLGGCSGQTDCSTAKSFSKPSCAACAAVYPLGCWPLLHASGDHGLPPPSWHITKTPLYDHPDLENAEPDPPGWPKIAKGMSKALVSKRWKKYRSAGYGVCGAQCEAEKAQMCQMQPELCMQLRCGDLKAQGSGGDDRLQATCDALYSLDENIPLSLPAEQMLLRWRLFHSSVGVDCDGTCQLAKQNMCHLHPRLCVALRCEDAATGRGGAESLLPACTEQSAATPEEALAAVESAAPGQEEPLPLQVARARWRLAWALGGRTCGPECEAERQQTCLAYPLLCAELRCEDVWSLQAPTDILPACGPFYPPPRPPASPLTEKEVAVQWAQLLDASPKACDSECRAAKEALCAHQPELCLQLLCGETSMAGHWQPELEQTCDWAGLDRDLEVLLPSSAVIQQQVEAKWAQLVSGQQPCGAACDAYKRRICLGAPQLCVVLSCQDAEVYGATEQVVALCLDLLQASAAPQLSVMAAPTASEVMGMTGPQLAETWTGLAPLGSCGLECLAFRLQVCKSRGFHCIELTCADSKPNTELNDQCRAAAGLRKAKGSPGKGAGQELRTLVSRTIEESFAEVWLSLGTAEGGSCDAICEAQRKSELCAMDRSLCIVLRCTDNLAGVGPFAGDPALGIICQDVVDKEVPGDSFLLSAEQKEADLLETVWLEEFLSGKAGLDGTDPQQVLPNYEELFVQAWGAIGQPGGSTCGPQCLEAKAELCRIDVVMCIYMRCLDVAAGIDPNSDNPKVEEACQSIQKPWGPIV